MADDEQNREAYLLMLERLNDLEGRFTQLRRLGPSGGQGYFSLMLQGHDSASNRTVAIKVYNPDRRSDQYRVESFKREAQLLHELNGQKDVVSLISPLCEHIHTLELAGGIPYRLTFGYYVLELARSDVATVIAQEGWSCQRSLIAFRAMCRAIQRIHRFKIAHRDLKPSNFLIMPDGAVKLSDLGAARRIEGKTDSLLPSYPYPPGDLRYCAPELFALLHDEDPTVAFLADLYSLGAVLFELLSGTQLVNYLFDNEYVELLMKAMREASPGRRRATYDQFVDSIASGYPLPSLAAFGPGVPACIRSRLDDLYMSLASLDYRRRLKDFDHIFLKIDTSLIVLQNEEKYRRWHEKKENYRRLREEKRRSRAANVITLSNQQRSKPCFN